jgi:hypothetical protein
MLASTVQFSTTNRPPPGRTPRRTPPAHPAPTGTRQPDEWYENPGRPRHEDPTPTRTRTLHAPDPGGVRSLRTQQRAYDPALPPTPFPTRPRRNRPY